MLSIAIIPSWEYQAPNAYSVEVSADGNHVVVGTSSALHFLDSSGDLLWTHNTGNRVIDLAMPASTWEIAAVVRSNSSWGGGGPIVKIFNPTGDFYYNVSDGYYSSVAFSPNYRYYAVSYESSTGWYDLAGLWDGNSGWLSGRTRTLGNPDSLG